MRPSKRVITIDLEVLRMSRSDDVLNECREMLEHGAKLEEVVMALRQNGFSKVQSIKALIDL
jgi:hypothetical protein